jgi:hypothetical protein
MWRNFSRMPGNADTDAIFCREGYTGAEGFLPHLDNKKRKFRRQGKRTCLRRI